MFHINDFSSIIIWCFGDLHKYFVNHSDLQIHKQCLINSKYFKWTSNFLFTFHISPKTVSWLKKRKKIRGEIVKFNIISFSKFQQHSLRSRNVLDVSFKATAHQNFSYCHQHIDIYQIFDQHIQCILVTSTNLFAHTTNKIDR